MTFRDLISSYSSRARQWYGALSRPAKIALVVWAVLAFIGGILVLIFHHDILETIVALSHKWKESKYGGLVLFGLIVLISFPPLIGYSALSSIAGMMYGFPYGWPFLALATLVGSTLSFIAFRYALNNYARRLAQSNTKFAALSKTLEQDSFLLLLMIRLCPLPYSLSNGALASVPSVGLGKFVLATVITSPKLLGHIFVGDRLARLGTATDTTSKIVDVVSIAVAVIIGSATAYIIYNRTMERASLMEAAGAGGGYGEVYDEYEFDFDEEEEL